jgi:hypothetical protein
MKKTIFILLAIIISTFQFHGQTPKEIKKIEKGIKQLGLQAFFINDLNLVISQNEVSVGDWLGFVDSKRKEFLEYNNSDVLDSASYEKLMTYFEFLNNEKIENKVDWTKVFLYYTTYIKEHSLYGTYNIYNADEYGNEEDRKLYYEMDFFDLGTYYKKTGFYLPFTIGNDEIDKKYEYNFDLVLENIIYFMDFPVYGISYEKALEFANWQANFNTNSKFNKSKLKFKGRLMTEQEYETLLKSAGPKKEDNLTPYPDSIGEQGCVMMNVINTIICTSTETKINYFGENPVSVPIWSYNSDKYGLFNIYGNMAEMTMTKGIAKGGSFINYAKDTFYDKSQTYPIDNGSTLPNWLGFRIVFEVKLN